MEVVSRATSRVHHMLKPYSKCSGLPSCAHAPRVKLCEGNVRLRGWGAGGLRIGTSGRGGRSESGKVCLS